MSDEPIHVLVIDDDPAIVDMIRMGLETDGMKVFGAADGGEGAEVIGRERIDVVLLDIMMPRVDGWMTLMDIRNNPSTADLPVIMLSVAPGEETLQHFIITFLPVIPPVIHPSACRVRSISVIM